jgi:hypothetical protein
MTCCRFAGGCDLCATHAPYFTGGWQIKLRRDDASSGFAGKSSSAAYIISVILSAAAPIFGRVPSAPQPA